MKMDKEIIKFKNNEIDEIINHAYSIQQPRSNFQLEKFVVGQHESEEMKFYQLCLELTQGHYNLKIAELELEKMKIKYEILSLSDNPIDKIDAEILSLGINQTIKIIEASKSELFYMINMYKSFPIKYTREEIESNQESYWKDRLFRQAALEQLAVSTAQSEHFNSMRQAGLLEISNKNIRWIDKDDIKIELEDKKYVVE